MIEKQNVVDSTDVNTAIDLLKEKVRVFIKEREWEKFHNPKNLAASVSIEAAELLEVFQWRTEEEIRTKKEELEPKVKEELADVMIYCLSIGINFNIDLTTAILAKIKKNEAKYPANKWVGKAYL